MTTKIIGINEYRTKLTSLWKESKEKNIRYIVVVHNKPVFEVKPIFDDVIDVEFVPKLIEAKEEEVSPALRKTLATAVETSKTKLYNI